MADEWLKSTTRQVKVAQVNTTAPNVARVWNYLVGGRDNFETDRKAARQLIAMSPAMAEVGPATRAFHGRVVEYLVGAGMRQFLDIGTGMPTAGNTHDIAQGVSPVMKLRMSMRMTATGWPKSSVTRASSMILPGSRASASM